MLQTQDFQSPDFCLLFGNHDRSTMLSVYDHFSPMIYGYILKEYTSQPESEVLLEQVFIRAFRNAGDFDPSRRRFFSWLLTHYAIVKTEFAQQEAMSNG